MSKIENVAEKIEIQELDPILAEFAGKRWPLIPLLQRVQNKFGFIPPEMVTPIARGLGLFPSQVQGVITFYTQFFTEPRGKYLIRACRGTACHVRGARLVLKTIENQLGIKDGETTEDFQFTLETVACLGACALAPVVVVNDQYYGKMNSQKIKSVLEHFGTETS